VGPRASMDDVEKRKFVTLLGLELSPFGRPARSQSLYRLRYHASQLRCRDRKKFQRTAAPSMASFMKIIMAIKYLITDYSDLDWESRVCQYSRQGHYDVQIYLMLKCAGKVWA
jgi:hypothetical protein